MKTPLPALTAVLLLAACAAPSGPAGLEAAAPEARVRRIAVVPLNLSVRAPAELAGKGEPVWQALLAHFESRDAQVEVLSTITAERLWLDAVLGLDLSDREAALKEAQARFARGLAESKTFDLVVFPSVVLRPAKMRDRFAAWDGVRREVPRAWDVIATGLSGAASSEGVQVRGLGGRIAAASLHVSVLRPDGSEAHQGLGGLDLVQQPRRDDLDRSWTFEPRPDPFGDPKHLREGVDRAFAVSGIASRF